MDPTFVVDAWELWHARIDALAGPEEAEPDATHGDDSDGDGSIPSACPPVVVVEQVILP